MSIFDNFFKNLNYLVLVVSNSQEIIYSNDLFNRTFNKEIISNKKVYVTDYLKFSSNNRNDYELFSFSPLTGHYFGWNSQKITHNETDCFLYIGSEIKDDSQQNQLLFCNIFKDSPIGIVLVDRNVKVLDVNNAFCEFLGYSKEELLSINYETLIHPDDKALMQEKVNDLFSGSIDRIELKVRYYSKNRENILLKFKGSIIRDISGEIFCGLGMAEDITESEKIREMLHNSEEKYRMIVEDQTELICRWKTDGKIYFVNDAFADYFHQTAHSLIGKSFLDFFTDEDKKSLVSIFQSDTLTNVNEQPVIIEGETHWLVWTNRKKQNEKGEIVEIQSVGHDITDRKVIENLLWQKNFELESVFKAFPDFFFRLNPAGVIIDFAGDAAQLQIDPLNLLGSPLESIFPEDIAFSFEEVYQAISNNSVMSLEFFHQDTGIWQEIRFIKIFEDSTGAILRNISRRKNIELELVKARDFLEDVVTERTRELLKTVEKLEIEIAERIKAEEEKKQIRDQFIQAQKMEALGVLAGGIAHDFNNLMNVINGYTQMLMWDFQPEDPRYEDLKEIQEAALRAGRLTHQLLIFSRMNKSEKSQMNFNLLLDNITKMIKRIIGEDIEMHYTPCKGLEDVFADQSNMEQILMNLIINSRDAMPEGGEIFITTKNVHFDDHYIYSYGTAGPGNYVCVEITDTGEGMDKQTIERIFEPFFTTKGPGKGTGLGLSVVYGIVKEHEGWIEVESEKNKGTTFKIFIPAQVEPLEIAVTTQFEGKNYHGNGEKILLIEDEAALLKINSRALRDNGYTVITASTAESAIKEFGEHIGQLDLIFSDVVLPDKSGLDLVEDFLSQKQEIHVLLTSGYTAERSRLEDIQKKNIRFIQKPYKLSDLFKSVYEILHDSPVR